ncbi:MAG: hypothetical protein ACPL1D_02810, partial [Microgenomates group bacterium]
EIREEITSLGIALPSDRSKKLKIALIILGLFFILASIPAVVYLVKQRQEIRKMAAPSQVPPCGDTPTIRCWGECEGCNEWEVCCTHETGGQCDAWCNKGITRQDSPNCGANCGGGGGGGGAPQPQCPGAGTSCQGWSGTHCNTESCCEHTCVNDIWSAGTFCGQKCREHPDCAYRCGAIPTGAPTGGDCPYDVTPYVRQTGSLPQGYASCNNNGHSCLTLELPENLRHCLYLAEVYTDGPQDCGNTQAHQRSSNWIGHGGSVCFPSLPVDGDCKAQIDIRAAAGGAPAGNIITYLIDCYPSPPSPPPPEVSCLWIKTYNASWQELSQNQLNSLRPGDRVYFVVVGSGDGFDKARFRINNGNWQETTDKRPGTQEFYISYTIPNGVTDFKVEAEVHHPTQGWK